MKKNKLIIILVLASIVFISGCVQPVDDSADDSTTREIEAQKKLTIISYCKSTGGPPPCSAGEIPVTGTPEPTETLPPSLPTSQPTATTTSTAPPILPTSTTTATTSLPPTLTGSNTTPTASATPTSDCTVTYTPPKPWSYGPCTNNQKALTTTVKYEYKGATCKVSDIIPKSSEPCTSDPVLTASPTPTTSPSLTPTDVNPTPSASASPTPTPSVPPHIEVSTGIEVLYGVYLSGGSLVGATAPCGNPNQITGIKVGLTSDASTSIEQNGVASGNGYCWSMTSDEKSPKGWGGTGSAWGSPPSPFNQQYIMGQQATTSYEFKLYNSQPTLAQMRGNAQCGDVGSVVVRLYVKC